MADMTDYLEDKTPRATYSSERLTPHRSPSTSRCSPTRQATTVQAPRQPAGSYSRQAVTFAVGAGPGDAVSDDAVTFANMPAGTWTHAALFDSAGGWGICSCTVRSALPKQLGPVMTSWWRLGTFPPRLTDR
jgi:hypothetical protein